MNFHFSISGCYVNARVVNGNVTCENHLPDAFGEIAFPAGERLFQNGANHEAGPKQELGVEPKGKRVLRELVPHRSSHGGSSQCLQSKESVEMGKEEVAKQENLPGIEKNRCKKKLHLIRTAASSPRLAGSCAIMPFSGCGLRFIQFFLVICLISR